MKGISKNLIYIGLLIFIAITSHLQWFNLSSVLSSGDWQFRYPELIKGFLGGWNSWITFDNFGSPNIQLFVFPIRGLIWPIVVNLGFSYDLAVKISLLFIISLGGFLFPYFYIKGLIQDDFIAFVSSLSYATIIYFLIIETRHLFIAVVFCLLLLIVYFFNKALENNRLINWLVFSLFFVIGCIYELRIMYIVSFVLLLYFLFFGIKKIKNNVWGLLFSVGIFFLLSFYWIFPLLITGGSALSDTVSRDLFGDNLFSMRQAFTIFRWSWTGGFEDRSFIVQPIKWYLWLVPLIAFSSSLFRNKYKKNTLFFLIISLIGIFLTKQSAEPFGGVYIWLYKNLPGFNLFREASKIYLITSFAYLGLIAYVLVFLKKANELRYVYIFLSIVLILVSVTNLAPLITTEIGGIFINRSNQIPNDYKVLSEFFKKENTYFRVAWVPLPISWGYYSDMNPRVSFTQFQLNNWSYLKPNVYSASTLPVLEPFLYPYSKNLFGQLSIKYFILPIQEKGNYSDVFESYGEKEDPNIREYYKHFLDNLNYLGKVDLGTKDLVVYENKYFKEPILSFSKLIDFNSLQDFNFKYDFSRKLGDNFSFVSKINNKSTLPRIKIDKIFKDTVLTDDVIKDSVGKIDDKTRLYINIDSAKFKENLYLNGERVSQGLISLNKSENIFEYKNPKYKLENVISNSSFESGVWQKKIGDCHNYDKNPILAMSLNKEEKTDGVQSLQLEATRHNACSSIKLPVEAKNSYLFSFDYQSPNANKASYYLSFNDAKKTVIKEALPIKDQKWKTFSKTIRVPDGAEFATLYVYANSTDEKTNIINRYDNFKLIKVPDLSDAYYLVSEPDTQLKEPKSISFDLINPTKKLVHIKGATTPFFLAMSESYHPKWQLQFNNGKIRGLFNSWVPFVKPDRIPDEYHYKLNDFLNGWYVDVNDYCAKNNQCVKKTAGSYDMEMTIEFFPQRWFYLGLLVSGTTLVGCLGYLGYEGGKRIKTKLKKKNEPGN